MSEIARDEGQIIVRPGKDVVASMAQEFRHELQSLVEEGTKELVIDLAGVEMVDSTGMAVLIGTHDSLSKTGGKLIVVNASKDIFHLFRAMRLDQHFTVIST